MTKAKLPRLLLATLLALLGSGSAMAGTTDGQGTADTAAGWRSGRGQFFKRNWGVEIIGVKPSASGYMLTLRYRVLDPDKAKLLNDRRTKAYLVDEASGTTLAVPALENIGELRNGAAQEANRSYYMVFGNPGKLVKSGSRVSVVAGNFHIDGLVVD